MIAVAGLSSKVGGWKTQKLIVRSPQLSAQLCAAIFPKQWIRETRDSRGRKKIPAEGGLLRSPWHAAPGSVLPVVSRRGGIGALSELGGCMT